MTMVISGSDGVTFPDSTTQNTTDRYGFVNRIINGDMRIDQRNAGAAVTADKTSATYGVDRFFGRSESADGVYTIQQTTTAPANFVNSLKVTVTTADASIGATQRYQIQQRIEGYNIADLGWGTANAKTVTLSFWVRSSLTGTFGGSFVNSDATRSYPFTYSISVVDTWEYKSVTIAGDTSGTWLTTNGIGIQIIFALGTGSTYLGTAGAWSGNFYTGATGQTQVISTSGATFYITGVQLEVGSVATPFERRPFGAELVLCLRYYWKNIPGASGVSLAVGATTSAQMRVTVFYPTTMRSAPSFLINDLYGDDEISSIYTVSGLASVSAGNQSALLRLTSSGMTSGRAMQVFSNSAASFIAASAEL
jgi:hypothetical protein